MTGDLNIELFGQQYRAALKRRGLNPGLCHTARYKILTFEEEKAIEQARTEAEQRTRELQDRFNTLRPDNIRFQREFIRGVLS